MGHKHWGTEEQVAYLKSFVGGLDLAKVTCTLETEYVCISKLFIEKWPTIPSERETASSKDAVKVRALADKRRKQVSRLVFTFL